MGDFYPRKCGVEGAASCDVNVPYPDVGLENSGSSSSGSTSWIWLAFSRANSLSRSANAMRLERDAYRMARDNTLCVMSSASSTQRNSLSSLQDNYEKTVSFSFPKHARNRKWSYWRFHTDCKHLHEQLLFFLLGPTLSFFVYLIAAGWQEAVVVAEKDWTPVLLLLDDNNVSHF